MKTAILTILVVFVFYVSNAQSNKKPYSFKTAYVEYEIEGNTNGKQTLYIDDWGWNKSETTQTVTKILGQKTETNERKVTLKLDLYQWTPGEKTGTKIHNTMLEDLLADPNFDMNEFGLKTMESLGFEKTGKETVNGKSCDIWKGLGSTIWIWNDIAVKSQVKILGTKYVMTATKIELNASIPNGEFQIPSNIKFTESSLDPSQMMLQGSQQNNTNSDNVEPEIKSLKDLKGLFKK
jgi:hypothetical protein